MNHREYKEIFRKAGRGIAKHRRGEHFTNSECVAVIQAIDLMLHFASEAGLPLLHSFIGPKWGEFMGYATARNLKVDLGE